MIFKLFSDKFLERVVGLGLTIPQILGFNKTRLIFYPFITGKGLQDIRNVFKQTKEEDMTLIDYYSVHLTEGMTTMEKAQKLSEIVNARLKYMNDSAQFERAEYWARPIEIHRSATDDCDGYAVLLCYLLRLFGVKDWEVFVAAGWVENLSGDRLGHAYVLVLDTNTMQFFPLEGSFYAKLSRREFGKIPLYHHKRYKQVWFITNDKVSYSRMPWLKFIK